MRFSIASIILVLISTMAPAQTPTPVPDIIREPLLETGEYRMIVEIPTEDQNDSAVFEACCFRVDVEPMIELGCAPRDPTSRIIDWNVMLQKTVGDNAEVRCYTSNSEDNSDLSHNAYIMLFPTRPNTPTVR